MTFDLPDGDELAMSGAGAGNSVLWSVRSARSRPAAVRSTSAQSGDRRSGGTAGAAVVSEALRSYEGPCSRMTALRWYDVPAYYEQHQVIPAGVSRSTSHTSWLVEVGSRHRVRMSVEDWGKRSRAVC